MQSPQHDRGQAATIAMARAMRDITGNIPPLPGIFPDYRAPIHPKAMPVTFTMPEEVERLLTVPSNQARQCRCAGWTAHSRSWRKARKKMTQRQDMSCTYDPRS